MHKTIRQSLSGLRDKMISLEEECHATKTELRKMLRENITLRARLGRRPPTNLHGMPNVDLPALRRRTAYYCHPDRGGDGELMRRLNTLFDFLIVSEGYHVNRH